MPRKMSEYQCEYCHERFDSYEECVEHEQSHIRNYSDADTKEIVAILRQMSEEAHMWHVFNTVAGMPVSNFESLMDEAARRLEEGEN